MTTNTAAPASRRFAFRLPLRWRLPLLLHGVTPGRAYAELDDTTLRARFGWWRLEIPLSQISDFEITGPYRSWRAIGLRLTLGEWGVTFGSATDGGVCLRFQPAVRFLRTGHPNLTVTVDDLVGLATALRERGIPGADVRRPFP